MINGRSVHVLVERGSTHSFINCRTLQRVGLVATEIDHDLKVEIVNGQHMISRHCCQDVRIKFSDDYEFAGDLLALDMGPIDAVLGCDWLQSLGKISIDLNALSLEFCHKGRTVTL